MVVSLLLIVIILTPVLNVFSYDVNNVISSLNLTHKNEREVKNLIESKKNEIQASQRAYILEQMAVQMKNNVKEELMYEYGYKMTDLELVFDEDQEKLTQNHLKQVNVLLVPIEEEKLSEISKVKEVVINISKPVVSKDERKREEIEKVKLFLSESWELSKQKLMIDMEGRGMIVE